MARSVSELRFSPLPASGALGAEPLRECLPFTVAVARSEEDLRDAARIRQLAYARHLPSFAQTLGEPEPADREPGNWVLLARAKLDGSPLGSLRIQTNLRRALELEASMQLPPQLAQAHLAEATRLCLAQGEAGRLVKAALFKAFYLVCLSQGVEHMVITGRTPIDRQYQRLLFEDVWSPQQTYPMAHVHQLPHRVMHLHVPSAQARWQAAQHPLLRFMCSIEHPDLKLPSASVAGAQALH